MDNFGVSDHWEGEFDENRLRRWVEELSGKLGAPASLGLAFISPALSEKAQQLLEILQVHGRIRLLAGCSSQGQISGERELEDSPGVALGLYALPGAELQGLHFNQDQVEKADGPGYWRLQTGIDPGQTRGWLAFVDPFSVDCENWLRSWNEAYAPLPVYGGLASGDFTQQQTQVYLNGAVYDEGGVAISVAGDVRLTGITSQGCTPIGDTWTLTAVEQNIIRQIANRRAYDVLAETFQNLPPDEQRTARGNLFIGLVMNEYLEDFHRGDFLVRNLAAADPQSGSLAVGALPRAGQTIQFQRRSADAATEDLKALLDRIRTTLAGRKIYGGCLCVCNGRGSHLFGTPSHDARMVCEALGNLAIAGFFCNGEIGPVGDKNFLHGYTASLALFTS